VLQWTDRKTAAAHTCSVRVSAFPHVFIARRKEYMAHRLICSLVRRAVPRWPWPPPVRAAAVRRRRALAHGHGASRIQSGLSVLRGRPGGGRTGGAAEKKKKKKTLLFLLLLLNGDRRAELSSNENKFNEDSGVLTDLVLRRSTSSRPGASRGRRRFCLATSFSTRCSCFASICE
jgi:hypothetical protein